MNVVILAWHAERCIRGALKVLKTFGGLSGTMHHISRFLKSDASTVLSYSA